MTFTTPLISAEALQTLLNKEANATHQPLIFDCSFDLMDPSAGARAHADAHLPGARYLHLEHDLSGPKSSAGPREGGRHPLPDRQAFAVRLGQWGVTPGRAVVVYDAQGAAYAARAWWLMRWLGHTQVSVLDGGLQAWQAAGGQVQTGTLAPTGPEATYPAGPAGMKTVGADDLLKHPERWTVVDARAPERYRGEVEPLDSRAGHIPGALNLFFKDNLGSDGRFLPKDALADRFATLTGNLDRVVNQCGSGVTACHNILAMVAAGLGDAALYPGSWSEWSADPDRPVAQG